jgi:hypothetical protein
LTKPKRIQGIFITPQEIQRVVDFIKNKGSEVSYIEGVTSTIGKTTVNGVTVSGGGDGDDELLAEAKEIIFRTDKASASLLQRHLRIGYARAARILDLLEEQGVIGPADGAKPREVYYTSDVDDHVASVNDENDDNSEENNEETDEEEDTITKIQDTNDDDNEDTEEVIEENDEEIEDDEQDEDEEVEEDTITKIQDTNDTDDDIQDGDEEEEEVQKPKKSTKKDSYIGKFDDEEKF